MGLQVLIWGFTNQLYDHIGRFIPISSTYIPFLIQPPYPDHPIPSLPCRPIPNPIVDALAENHGCRLSPRCSIDALAGTVSSQEPFRKHFGPFPVSF